MLFKENVTTRRETTAQRKKLFRRALLLCTADGLVAMPIVTMSLPVNVFLTALYTKSLDLPKSMIGFIAALPFICNFLQVFVTPFLIKRISTKQLAFLPASFHLVAWAALVIMLGYMPTHDPGTSGRWLASWYFVSSFAASFAGVGWNSWIQEWVPARLRGKYFGQRNRLLSLSTLAFLLVTGWALARWNYSIPVFQVIIVGAVILRIFSLKWIWDTPSANLEAPRPKEVLSFKDQMALIRRSKSFLAFIGFGAIWSFAANVFGPFYHVFMFEELQMSAFDVGILSTISALGGALSLGAWGQMLDRYGNKSVMSISLVLWQLGSSLWCFLDTSNRYLLYPMWAWGGITSAGFILGQFTMALKLIPIPAKSLALGVNLAITSLVAAIAPILGGQILGRALSSLQDPLLVYHVCFVVQPVLALAGAMTLLRIREPSASSLTNVVGAMRNIRTLSGIFGLSFLTNYVFYRPQPKRHGSN